MKDSIHSTEQAGTRGEWPVLQTKPYFENDSVRLYRGNSLEVLDEMRRLNPNRPLFDALITDPPYCSGADSKSGRDADPAKKYCQNGNTCGRPTFSGDHLDARSFQFWCVMWLSMVRQMCHPSRVSTSEKPDSASRLA